MEPKFEQPKQYTPEEIAQLEKSRTISDAELLKGGAEYEVNERGETSITPTAEQFNMMHERFVKEEGFLKERQKIFEERAYFYNTVSEYVGKDIIDILSKGKYILRMPDNIGPGVANWRSDHFDPAINDLLEALRAEYIKKIENSDLLREVKLRLKNGVDHHESLFDCAGCMWGYLDSINQDRLTKKIDEEREEQKKRGAKKEEATKEILNWNR